MSNDLPNDIKYRIRSILFEDVFRFFELDYIQNDTNSSANLNELYSLFKIWFEKKFNDGVPQKCELDDYFKKRYSKSNQNEFNDIRICIYDDDDY